MEKLRVGGVVSFRDRLWVVLSRSSEALYLRPLTGGDEEAIEVHPELAKLLGYSYPTERLEPAQFPLPQAHGIKDAGSVHLFWQAARLLLRENSAPIRSMGRISVRPRTYQLVPLLMALRLDPVRLLIADDVGVGKTIEAALIARELWDRGEIRRLAVLCPPYLCDQWAKELSEKFHFQPVVVNSATVGLLEREVPSERSVYSHFPVQVLSIDFVKRERNKYLFLQHAPELVIVDEVHGATPAGGRERHLRYELVRALADDPRRHLLLLTATPHSGVPQAFQRLLGLLDREFESWDPSAWTEEQRIRLARHFVQRTRRDIEKVWEKEEPLFPEREPVDVTYTLSPEQRRLFEAAHEFCLGIVQKGRELTAYQRRMRYWAALALLRAVMSSPAAAKAALEKRRRGRELEETPEEEWDLGAFAYEPTETPPPEEAPWPLLERPESGVPHEEPRLRRLLDLARAITPEKDAKLQGCIRAVKNLLREGFHPIVWCFYVATAEYVAHALEKALAQEFPEARVLCITGRLGEEERRALVEDFMEEEGVQRVLVATECLSEGINLQKGFNAVLHYDLPWNPNRLEQREGRVDRFGQKAPKVRVVRFYGRDNPVDGAVIRVLLNKAREIRQSLGTYVPVPVEEEYVIEALVHALFSGPAARLQEDLAFEFMQDYTAEFHRKWDLDAERERESRTRFAQRALHPEEVERELRATDAILGAPEEVERFVLEACQRLGIPLERDRRNPKVYHLNLSEEVRAALPPLVRAALPQEKRRQKPRTRWTISFASPTPENAEYVGRNHRFVVALAQHLFESALSGKEGPASRCGAIRTDAVSRLTILLLLRARYLLELPEKDPILAEEVLVTGFVGGEESLLPREKALGLLGSAKPVGNIPEAEKRELVEFVLERVKPWVETEQSPLRGLLEERSVEIAEAHRRLRRTLGERVRGLAVQPQWPPDVLGILVLQPAVGR